MAEGMQKRGMAKADQAKKVSKTMSKALEKGNYIPTAMMLQVYPRKLPRKKLPFRTSLRPLKRLMAIGHAYEAVKQMTPTPEKALKAAAEPK